MQNQRPLGMLNLVQQYMDSFFSSLHISAGDMISYVTYFGVGFLFGIALKRYGKWAVSIAIAAALMILVLHYFELIQIQQNNIKVLLGIENIANLDDAITLLHMRVQTMWIQLVLMFIAIIVGFKLG